MPTEMSVAEPPATTLCARAAGGGAGAPNPLDEFGPVHVVKRERGRPRVVQPIKSAEGGSRAGRVVAVKKLAADGLSTSAAAALLGVTRQAVQQFASEHGIDFVAVPRGIKPGTKLSGAHLAGVRAGQRRRREREKRNSGGTSPAVSNHCTAEPVVAHALFSHGASS